MFKINRYQIIHVIFILGVVLIGLHQYQDAESYRFGRMYTGAKINERIQIFKKIESITFSKKKQIVIIVMRDVLSGSLPLGFYGPTYNSWKARGNQSFYIIASFVRRKNGTFKFRAPFSQYYRADKYYSTAEYFKEFTIKDIDPNSKTMIAMVSDGVVDVFNPSELPKLGLYYDFDVLESYGGGHDKSFFWTSGNFSMDAFHPASNIGGKALLSFTVTSLFDDNISFSYPGHHEFITVKSGVPYAFSRIITIDGEEMKFSLNSKKSKVPPGDPRTLSFLLDDDISYKLLESVKLKFSHEYDIETDHSSGKNFFWTSGNFSMNAFHATSMVGKKTLLSFTVTSLFDDNISFSYPGHHELITVKSGVPYAFSRIITIDGEEMKFSLNSKKSKVPPGDPRTLSFLLDDDISYKLLESVKLKFSHEYDIETDHSSGKNFFWTSGNFSMNAFHATSMVGKKTLLSFTVTSLFDDNISFSYPGYHELITLKAGVPYTYSRMIIIDGEEMKFSLNSKKSKVPSGDSRLLSFRLDDHITYELAKLQ